MTSNPKTVRDYLKSLGETRKDKPSQVKEALSIYTSLWEAVIARGIVKEDDDIETALSKIEERGGLYHAAEE